MSEKRFEVIFYGDVINCVRDENGKEYNLHEIITILNEQQEQLDLYKEAILTMLGLLADKGIILSGVKDE